jgi:hypothetical protein
MLFFLTYSQKNKNMLIAKRLTERVEFAIMDVMDSDEKLQANDQIGKHERIYHGRKTENIGRSFCSF